MERGAHFPVVVVGAGPTGLTLANLLGVYGVRALVVERNGSTVPEPRAVSIDDESLRTMQAAGLVETVLRTVVPGYGSEYRTPSGRIFLKVQPTGAPYGYPRRNAFRQPVFEAQLRDGLARFPEVEARFGWTLKDFEQGAEGVRLVLLDAHGREVGATCDFLVGADGASSTVRGKLGIPLEGATFAERWLIVDLERSPAASRETQVFCDVRRPCIALPGPDLTRRFEFKLHPGETAEEMTAPEMVEALLKAHGADPGSVIVRKVVYTFHARLSRKWSDGRVFLAGDACHLSPPFAGQGMNSGIRDAHNLAWKLAWVVGGRAPTRLLATYEAERRDHVWAMIQLALRMGRVMGPPSRLAAALTQGAFRLLGMWPWARDYFAEMKYKPKPRFADGFLIPDGQGARATPVGRLVPQPLVTGADGAEALFDSCLGDGFAAVGVGLSAEAVAAATTDPVFDRLSVRRVGLGEVAEAMAGQRGRILLVRPDRYVAGAFTPSEAGAFADRLRALLAEA